ncbi:MAG: helix-turn-helix domain-containing protein [Acidimicrobiales bacterium]|nr:helix-turn-helix domain-containing protein [Acidimicrobiales bacterium]
MRVTASVPRSIGRVLDLMEFVMEHQPCTLSRAAEASDLTPTTALRHLRALETRGYLTRSEAGEFSVGPTMLRLAAALRQAGPLDQLVAVSQPLLDQLAEETGESAYLAVCDHRVATYIAMAESRRAIRHVGWVGQTIPLAGTAVGAAIDAPGQVATRTGAVEPDITAFSIGVGTIRSPGIAVSVIGPAHRLAEADSSKIEDALGTVAVTLAMNLGASEGVEAS